ncbi:MAG: hypothetical protein OHK0046_35480 [Anaerolineae bacterium]
MRRQTRLFSFVITCMLILTAIPVLGQPPFGGTPNPGGSFPPGGGGSFPPGVNTTPGTSSQPPFGNVTPAAPSGDAAVVTPETPVAPTTPAPTETPVVDPNLELLVTARLDLERLADMALPGARPDGWNGTVDPNNAQFAPLLRLDLELLAGTMLGADSRPADWFGFVNSTPYAFARDIRHDLELLADQLGRPADWAGAEPLLRCDRTTQAVVQFLESNGVFTLQADRTASDFCVQAAVEAAMFMEINLLANPATLGTADSIAVFSLGGGSASVNSPYAAAFFDRSAGRRAGVVPDGTSFEPVGRSTAQFSKMMLIRGEGFEVFVDHQFTTVTVEEFETLPSIDEMEFTTSCTANWCENG